MGDIHVSVARALVDAGARKAFTVASAHNVDLLDALLAEGVDIVPSRCELTAGHAADGYARTSGEPTLLVTSTGPGAGNAVGAIATAAKDCSDVIHVTTSNEVGLGQAVHTVPEQAGWHRAFDAPLVDVGGEDLDRLVDVLRARTGVMTVVVPFRADRRRPLRYAVPCVVPSDTRNVIGDVSPWLRSNRRLLLIGGGARKLGREVLLELVERSGAAVVTTTQGKDLFPSDHSQFLGCTLQSQHTRNLAAQAEVCLAIGSRITDLSTGTWGSPFPPLLLRVAESSERPDWPSVVIRDVGTDIGLTLDGVLAALPQGAPPVFGTEIGAQAAGHQRSTDRSGAEYSVIDAVCRGLDKGDTLVCDMTKLSFWVLTAGKIPTGARFLWPGLLSMGFGLPAGVGASHASPRGHVVVLVGDGGLLSVLPALEDAVRVPGRLSIVLIDDNGYGILRPKASREVATGLCSFAGPRWSEIADAFGLSYVDVGDPSDLAAKLASPGADVRLLRVDGDNLAIEHNWMEA